jgi:hypothetical protein
MLPKAVAREVSICSSEVISSFANDDSHFQRPFHDGAQHGVMACAFLKASLLPFSLPPPHESVVTLASLLLWCACTCVYVRVRVRAAARFVVW